MILGAGDFLELRPNDGVRKEDKAIMSLADLEALGCGRSVVLNGRQSIIFIPCFNNTIALWEILVSLCPVFKYLEIEGPFWKHKGNTADEIAGAEVAKGSSRGRCMILANFQVLLLFCSVTAQVDSIIALCKVSY